MPIRFKTVQYCWMTTYGNPSYTTVCIDQVVPIRDWSATPAQLNKVWTQGTAVTALYQDVTFPELEFVYTNPAYASFKFKIRKVVPNTDWLQITSTNFGSSGQFQITSPTTIRFWYNFLYLDNLPVGLHTIDVIFEAYGISGNGNESYLESFSTSVTLEVKSGVGIATDKNEYQLTFNKANNTLSGDPKIIVYTNDPVTYNVSDLFIQLTQSSQTGQKMFTFINNTLIQAKPVGDYTGTVTLNQNGFTKNITVKLKVINDATEFDVNPKTFAISLQRTPGSVKTETAAISNPNNLTILVDLFPSFIESATITGNTLTFSTKNSSTLAIGNYSGKIILKAGVKTKEISVSLNIFQPITHDFVNAPYFFALDPNKATLIKTHPEAAYVKMKLVMYFKAYGEEYNETQFYTVPFFQGKVEFFPGREINDFFIKCRNLAASETIQELMNLAQVSIAFNEMNDNDQELSAVVLSNLLFAPGKKPVCFPVFTNYPVRSTYPKSRLKLNVDRLSVKPVIVSLINIYKDPFPGTISTTCVDQYTFKRERFAESFDKKPIQAGNLTFIPLPEKRELIHIEWETENLVFDWFSAPLRFQQKDEIESILGETADYKEEKFESSEKSLLTINSGWILPEEIPMITDILKSRLCFLNYNGKRIKVFPVGKSNELMRNDETVFQMDLEFKILKENQ